MSNPDRPTRDVVVNRRARRNYEILDKLEAGIALSGTEVKTLRTGQVSLAEAYVKVRKDGLWLVGAHIDEYEKGSVFNHEPTRDRRLLVHAREMAKLTQKAKEKGLTLVPLRLYFRGKWAKVEIGLGRGRKLHDKREHLKKRESQRDLRRAMGRD
ncbi:MAG: SsrA-binding protein SmpB [Planctomycetota bacterium]|nr:MAG: SsrA-binding protein SmpB [Planctomycetota bacterium]